MERRVGPGADIVQGEGFICCVPQSSLGGCEEWGITLRDRLKLSGCELQGQTEATCWNNCTEPIRGSDGTQFRPGVLRNQTLNVWVPQLYRVLPFVYREDSEWLGVNFLRFWPVRGQWSSVLPVSSFDVTFPPNSSPPLRPRILWLTNQISATFSGYEAS